MEQLSKTYLLELRAIVENDHKPSDCRIRAHNDIEALERWLDEYFEKPTTFRSYKKEGERFLVWCALERHTKLAGLTREDVEAYIQFLKNPQPYEKWCGPKGGRKNKGDHWRPFTGPLSESAIKTSLAILNSFMSYLVEAGYVRFNAFALVRKKNRFNDNVHNTRFSIEERILNENEWQALLGTMHAMSEENEEAIKKKQRLVFLLSILYFLGLRIDELAHARWSNFRHVNGKWWFFVRGKGDKVGKIPVNQHLWQAVIKFRHHLGLSVIPKDDDTSPLLCSLGNNARALSARQMSNLLKELAIQTSLQFSDQPQVKKKFERFSPHWLRHLSASRQDLAGIAFTHIKENLRHQSEQTTRHYVHAYDDERHKDMEKLDF